MVGAGTPERPPPCPACGALPPPPAPDPTVDRHLLTAARLRDWGRLDDAVAVLRCPAPATAPWPDRTRIELGLAELMAGAGDLTGAREVLLAQVRPGVDPADSAGRRAQALVEHSLAVLAHAVGDLDGAARHRAAAQALSTGAHRPGNGVPPGAGPVR